MNWILTFIITTLVVFQPKFKAILSPFAEPEAISTNVSSAYNLPQTEPYFKGHGLNPGWKIEVSSDSILFTSEVAGFEVFTAAHQYPVKDHNRKIYDCFLSGGQLQIEITNESCAIDGSNESFIYSLIVSIRPYKEAYFTRFEGCGHYITDVMLNGRWILEQIKEESVDMIAFQDNLPSLEIVTKSNSFSGFAGCNKISGRIFSEQSLLRFTDIVSTKMSCDHLENEDEFLKALGFSTQFVIEKDRLILSNPINTTLIFKKEE